MDDRPRRFAGKAALVVGGASPVGRAVAVRLAEEGAAVAVADLDPEAASETCRQVEAAGGRALLVRADVARPGDAERTVAAAIDAFGRPHVLCVDVAAPAGGDWGRDVCDRLKGVFLTADRAIAAMRDGGGGAVVFAIPDEGGPAGAAARGAVVGYARRLAADHGAKGVRVNCVAVGPTDAAPGATAARRLPLRRLGTAAEVAAVVAFLASDEASFVTGACVPVDGGRRAAER